MAENYLPNERITGILSNGPCGTAQNFHSDPLFIGSKSARLVLTVLPVLRVLFVLTVLPGNGAGRGA